ncbi:hypothetical protein MKJ04_07930 [Pontibacter sp. E15-1]|uniref:hypothetical protein n=1 Tax=Pontibacter sp. E15-1 TaxID=2919918 RepID=UPI001F502DC4|nr:hypothetical protein [Pontibacter sp. E15-1]MCJ8164769.1 hypothetical protein [Pontibacter sp. E15-1]
MLNTPIHTMACSGRAFTYSCLLVPAFLILFALAARAEGPDYTLAYHPVVQEAEAGILAGDYAQALDTYRKAFAAVPLPFAKDYYNAAVCAWKLNDTKQTLDYLEQLVLKGVSLPYLERQQVFDSLRTTRKWKKFVRRYPKRRRKFEESLNKELRADLDELYARDQYFREAAGGWRVHGDTIRKIEAANVAHLLAWTEQYGYPGENLIGVADTLEQLPRFSIVIQRQTKARKGYDFTALLTKAVQEGRMAPQPVAYLLDQQAGRNMYGSKAFVKVSCSKCPEDEQQPRFMVEKMSDSDVDRINENRKALGLEPLEEYKKKVLFGLQQEEFRLAYDWSVKQYVVPSREAANILMEGLTSAE